MQRKHREGLVSVRREAPPPLLPKKAGIPHRRCIKPEPQSLSLFFSFFILSHFDLSHLITAREDFVLQLRAEKGLLRTGKWKELGIGSHSL